MKVILEENKNKLTKEQAIKKISELFIQNKIATENYYQAMLKREKQASFYIGNHIAIPHGIRDDEHDIITPGIVIMRMSTPIKWDANDVFYVIGIASKNDDHIEILTNIAINFDDVKKVNESLKKPLKDVARELGWS